MPAQSPPFILKDEPGTRVEIRDEGGRCLVHKHHRTRRPMLWQSFLRRSRTDREFANLRAIAAAGIPCIEAIAWDERRWLGCVAECSLTTALIDDTRSLAHCLDDPDLPAQARRQLAVRAGQLLRQLHDAGLIWLSCAPRNFLVRGDPGTADMYLLDPPYALRLQRSVFGSAWAIVDLFPACFHAHRRRQLDAHDRRALLEAYCHGDREVTDQLWRRFDRLSPQRARLIKNLAKLVLGYLHPRRIPRFPPTPRSATEDS